MNQLDRIAYFEEILNHGEKLTKNFQDLIEEFKAYQSKIDELDSYYQSKEREIDVKDDENNKFPSTMPRGVLGQDYTYDLLVSWDAIKEIIKKY